MLDQCIKIKLSDPLTANDIDVPDYFHLYDKDDTESDDLTPTFDSVEETMPEADDFDPGHMIGTSLLK
jgi:hypothetical protein